MCEHQFSKSNLKLFLKLNYNICL